MRGAGADGLVVVQKPGNAGGAKEPDDLAEGAGQEAVGKAIESREAWIVVNHAMLALVEEGRACDHYPARTVVAVLLICGSYERASARRTVLLCPRHHDGRSWLHE